jgi:hypothetical protein
MRLIRRANVHDILLILAALLSAGTTPAFLVAGAAVWALGLALQNWSKAALHRDLALSTSGPYALCRHPFYLANLVFDLGIALMSGNLWLVALCPAVFALGYAQTFREEEDRLAGLFPDAHRDYCRSTGMIVPTSLRVLRNWQTPLSWRHLVEERQVSRNLRFASYPLVVWLVSRLWADPTAGFSTFNLALASAAAGLTMAGVAALIFIENRYEGPLLAWPARFLGRTAAPAVGAAFLLVALILEPGIEALLLAGAVAALLLGWSLICSRGSRGIAAAGLAAIAAFACIALDILWLAPLALGIIAASAFAPTHEPRTLRLPARPRWAGASLIVVGSFALGLLALSEWSAAHGMDSLRAAVAEEAQGNCRVVILEDSELHALADSPFVAGELTADQIGRLTLRRAPGERLIVLAEDDDLYKIPDAARRQLHVRRTFRVWLETFYLLETPEGIRSHAGRDECTGASHS